MIVDNDSCWFHNRIICIDVMDSSCAVYYSTFNATRKFPMIHLFVRVWIKSESVTKCVTAQQVIENCDNLLVTE